MSLEKMRAGRDLAWLLRALSLSDWSFQLDLPNPGSFKILWEFCNCELERRERRGRKRRGERERKERRGEGEGEGNERTKWEGERREWKQKLQGKSRRNE